MADELINHRPELLNQVFMEGVEEIIGLAGMHALANQVHALQQAAQQAGELAWSRESPSLTQQALEELYGGRGGRGIALRAGRSSFKSILRQHGSRLGLTDLNYRLLPAPLRVKTGLEALARLFSDGEGQVVSFKERESAWYWLVEESALCQGRHDSSEPVCAFLVGLLQEFLAWASSGKVYAVREMECQGMGMPACLFKIDQKPLE